MQAKTLSIIGIIIAFVIGIAVGMNFGYKNGYEKAWNKANNLVEEKLPLLKTPEEIYSLSGEVLEVGKDYIKIKAQPVTMNPLSELYKETIRIVKINENTEIVKQEMKSVEEIRKEMEMNKTSLPLPFIEKKISLSEIKKGDNVNVEVEENILTKQEFVAKRIILVR